MKSTKAGSIPIASTVFFAICMLPLGLRQDLPSVAAGKLPVGIGNASIAGSVPRGNGADRLSWMILDDEEQEPRMSLKEEITKAIGAHGMWKARLRTAIDTGKSDVTAADAGKDNACAFGQWLYGSTLDPAARSSGDFKEVQKLHAEFHKAASQVLQLALQERRPKPKR